MSTTRRKVLIALVLLLLAPVVFLVEEHVRGRAQLRRIEAELRARGEKLTADRRAAFAGDVVRVYVDGSAGRIASAARQVIAALADRGVAVADLVEGARRLSTSPGVDTMAAQRRIADAVIQAERFPL